MRAFVEDLAQEVISQFCMSATWDHLLDQREKLVDVEWLQNHAFLGCQVLLHLLARRQHDDVWKHPAGVMPVGAQVGQEVRRVSVWKAQIEEQQWRTIARWRKQVYPGEGCLPPGTARRAIACQCQRCAEQLPDRRLLLGYQDGWCSGERV